MMAVYFVLDTQAAGDILITRHYASSRSWIDLGGMRDSVSAGTLALDPVR